MDHLLAIEFLHGPADGVTYTVALADLPPVREDTYAALLLVDQIEAVHVEGDLYRWEPGPGRPGFVLQIDRVDAYHIPEETRGPDAVPG